MSIYNEVSASNSEDRNYPYYKYIKPPEALGASSKGNLTALGSDIKAIMAYTSVLVSGQSSAQTISPLGNKYFMDTGATCTAPDGSKQSRFVYINNIPSGALPFMSGTESKSRQGLVTGALEDMTYINPMKLFTAFSKGTNCQQITMGTRDINNSDSTETEYILNEDIAEYSPCWFQNRVNPVTNNSCIEAMTLPRDPSVQLYAMSIGIVGIYILFCLLRKQ